MRRMLFAMLAVALMVSVPFAFADADAEGAPAPTGTKKDIREDTIVTATGTAGSAEGASEWTYSRSEDDSLLGIGAGSVADRSEWKITKLVIGEDEVAESDLALYGLDDILKETVDLTLDGDITVASGVMRSLTPLSLKIGEGCTSIPDDAFINCTRLATVDVGDAGSIGAGAFEGCSTLREIDVKEAKVDLAAFKNCTRLTSFKASGSSLYDVKDGILYTLGYGTLYLCPTAMTKQMGISDIDANTTVINLGYADVFYALDMKGVDRAITFVDTEGSREVKARGLLYSSQGMRSCSVTEISNGQGDFQMTYELCIGWSVVLDEGNYSGVKAALSGNTMRLTLEGDNLSAVAYPMGAATITYGDLAKVTRMGGWSVAVQGLPSQDGIVGDLDSAEVSVTGYAGSDTDAELGGTMRYRGISFEVSSVSLSASTAGNLRNLTIGDGIPIGKDSFTALSGLRSVRADYVSEVGDGAFRFCTSLTEASFASCSAFGAYAFEGCWSLESLDLGPRDVTFGDHALRGCTELDFIAVDLDAEVQGAEDVVVLHYDMSDTGSKSFEVHGNFVLISWNNGREVRYSGHADGSGSGTELFYYGSPDATTVIPSGDEIYIWVTEGSLPTNGRILVVFDYGLGEGYETQKVITGNRVTDPGSRTHLGYHFQYWTLDGQRFDFSTSLIQSTVLTAHWTKEDPVDTTPIYLCVILAASVLATFAVLAIARKKG